MDAFKENKIADNATPFIKAALKRLNSTLSNLLTLFISYSLSKNAVNIQIKLKMSKRNLYLSEKRKVSNLTKYVMTNARLIKNKSPAN